MTMEPLQVLFEDISLPAFELPGELAKLYGGNFGFADDAVVANFVASIDGVTAIPGEKRSSALISGGSEADRLVMGLLRAWADVIVIGAGTLRSHPSSEWTAAGTLPAVAASLVELRRSLGRHESEPMLAVVTGSGRIDADHPALAHAKVFTTPEGADALAGSLPREAVVTLGSREDELDERAVLDALRAEGYGAVLVEGGPHLLGGFVDEGIVNELFLTVSPSIAGRTSARPRPGLVEGVEFLPDRRADVKLLSLREHDSYLFLRYALGG